MAFQRQRKTKKNKKRPTPNLLSWPKPKSRSKKTSPKEKKERNVSIPFNPSRLSKFWSPSPILKKKREVFFLKKKKKNKMTRLSDQSGHSHNIRSIWYYLRITSGLYAIRSFIIRMIHFLIRLDDGLNGFYRSIPLTVIINIVFIFIIYFISYIFVYLL